MAQFSQYAMAATEEALDDAGWKPTVDTQKEATVRMTFDCRSGDRSADFFQGVCMGSGIGNFDEIYDTVVNYDKGVSGQSRYR